MSNKPRIVTLDIETAPINSNHWQIWDENIGIDQIELDWSILSYSFKWLDKAPVYFEHTGGNGPAKVRDDRELCQSLWMVLDDADLVVAQNGKKFDIKKINARFLEHGLPPYSPIRVIDTMLSAKSIAGFTSNKLAWLSKKLTPDTVKSAHKKFPGFELWQECLKDNPKAWAEMKKYNSQDVKATEQVYLKLRPWIANHPNLSTYHDEGASCPKCDSKRLERRGVSVTQAGRYQRFQCQDCGGWSRGKAPLIEAIERKRKVT